MDKWQLSQSRQVSVGDTCASQMYAFSIAAALQVGAFEGFPEFDWLSPKYGIEG